MKWHKDQRIMENIFDLVFALNPEFVKQARREMKRDMKGHNVTLSGDRREITIENFWGTRVLYTITIKKEVGKWKTID